MSDLPELSQQTGKDENYRVLARKYRPRDFSDLIGQEPMVRTLTNAFKTGRIAQAWMLTGVRGVGKTTTARILARALNYETDTVDKPSIELPEMGVHCQAIMEGRHVDVIEMDAASHTGIDDIREIIEQVRYVPVSARYKVFIIDEVHMLSTAAFNGLLKTLEEPPPHVKFVFATTEIRKVPVTILSRTQRFDLRRVDAGTLVQHLQKIAALEKVEIEPEALAMVARAAEGSVRDSLSILDQAIAHAAGKVEAQTVRAMLGLADRARIIDLFEHLMSGDLPAALGEFRSQYDAGADPAVILTDLAEFTHLVTRLRFVPEAADDASLSEEERERGTAFAQRMSVRAMSRAWQMLLKGIGEVQNAFRPVAAAEMVLIRIAHAADLPNLDDAIRMAQDMAENGAPASGQNGPAGNGGGARAVVGGNATAVGQPAATPTQARPAPTMRLVASQPAPVAQPAAATPEAEQVETPKFTPLASIADIIKLAETHRDPVFRGHVKRFVRPVSFGPGRISVQLDAGAPATLVFDMQNKLHEWLGERWTISTSREGGGRTLAEDEQTARETALGEAALDPTVAAILQSFPGAKIVDVRMPESDMPEELDEIDVDAAAQAAIDAGFDDEDDFET
ncbi:DNA polymerase III subunit gamma/tau [Notoacmeibacter sp. MSK16QG-6]|uniref:DNA polymerase III subunit gamma/tau n=1 Tax=Notoacmeibacter sp. MSK16QG-6 TaxID=2957982 RepID=UPI00209D1E32|nr:DNA polymerase III subunit gamma/tau [Notoacmeibacter sp. MSK16QG-6]MCP1198741.1 DNA polymerase III subunit gamma/tau [Notoacmeibacter sp. MSK16QG-6]